MFKSKLLFAAALIQAIPALSQMSAGPALLEGLEARPDEVVIQTSRPVPYRDFILTDPPRVVIELFETRAGASAKSLAGEGRRLAGVRAAQFSAAPAVMRVVLDLKEESSYRIEAEKNKLTLRLGGAAAEASAGEEAKDAVAAPPPLLQAPAQAADRPSASPAASDDGVEAQAPPAAPVVSEGPRVALAASVVFMLGGAVVFAALRPRLGKAGRTFAPAAVGPMPLSYSLNGDEARRNSIETLSGRLSILERKVSELGSVHPSGDSGSREVVEELAELKIVVRSILKALRMPEHMP